MDFSANLYNSRTWILDTVQKVLLSKANTENRIEKQWLKILITRPTKNKIVKNPLQKRPHFSTFTFCFGRSLRMTFLMIEWTRVKDD